MSASDVVPANGRRCVKVARKALFFATMLLGLLLYYRSAFLSVPPKKPAGTQLPDKRTCKIYEIDPFEPTVKRYLKNQTMQKCRKTIIYSSGELLLYDEGHESYDSATCCARTIHRKQQRPSKYDENADWMVNISETCFEIPKLTGLPFPSEFVQVQCTVKSKVIKDYYGTPFPPGVHSKQTWLKANFWQAQKTRPPNVLIVGIDSISRLHFRRSLPQTVELLEKHGFIEVKGYTRVGKNTFPNVMAFLGGMSVNKYPCWRRESQKFDDCPLIWKDFSKQNYVTGYLEDVPGLAAFNHYKTGFVQQPTDYYLRPLSVAYHDKLDHTKRFQGCVSGMTMTQMAAKYTKEFVDRMGAIIPYFLLTWYTSPAHDDFNGLEPFDPTFLDLIENVLNSPGGNDTVILFFSDHGFRRGSFRQTMLGYYEVSLPFLFLRVPPALEKLRPDWLSNLRRNSQGLTSTLDIHATLEDIASLSHPNFHFRHSNWNHRLKRSVYSLFEPIPLNRTCKSALIPEDYCRCGVNMAVGRKSSGSIRLGNAVVSRINEIIAAEIKGNVCVPLKYQELLYAREIADGEMRNGLGKLELFKDHLVGLTAAPYTATFEAKLRLFLNNGTIKIVGEISRTNRYEGQNDCLKGYKLKPYCICVDYYEKRKRAYELKRARKIARRKKAKLKITLRSKISAKLNPTVALLQRVAKSERKRA